MSATANKAIIYDENQHIITLRDFLAKQTLSIARWDKIGKGNTAIKSMEGSKIVRSYLVFLFQDQWYSLTVDTINGIQLEEIKEEDIEKNGPLLWLNNDTKSNW
jgi:hypothetical protein